MPTGNRAMTARYCKIFSGEKVHIAESESQSFCGAPIVETLADADASGILCEECISNEVTGVPGDGNAHGSHS